MNAQSTAKALSPYRTFSRSEWASLRADTPLTLRPEELDSLQSMNDPVSVEEVIEIYLPLSRLLALYVAATQELFRATERFLGVERGKVPYIIAVAGSVAAGKSTLSRILTTLLSRWTNTPKVQLITTDGFLLPNTELSALGLMEKKGFPESYDTASLLRFLSQVKAGQKSIEAPQYSHILYDIISDRKFLLDSPDILIVEGLNVLQAPPPGSNSTFVSDYFDFSIYLDADKEDLSHWYVSRFMKLRETAFRNPDSYFKKYATLTDDEARQTALEIWTRINLRNLEDNILPTRQRASLILTKDSEHKIRNIALRRL
jgi:type I pantothenate kinase